MQSVFVRNICSNIHSNRMNTIEIEYWCKLKMKYFSRIESCSERKDTIFWDPRKVARHSIIKKVVAYTAFVNLIPVAEQCSSTACIRPYHRGHKTGAVLRSGKHWHAVLEQCLALLKSYDSSTAVSAVTGHSGVLSLSCPYVKDLHQMWKIPGAALQALPASALIHCLT